MTKQAKIGGRSNTSIKPVNGLETLTRYTISRKPRAVLRLVNESGSVPYHKGTESLDRYLLRNVAAMVREEGESGMVKLLAIHPDKELILEYFGKAHIVPPVSVPDVQVMEEAAHSHFTGDAPQPDGQPSFPLTVSTGSQAGKDAHLIWGAVLIVLVLIFILK